jgi:protein TonB
MTNLQISGTTNIITDAPPLDGDPGPLVGSNEPAKPAEPEVDNNTVIDHPDVQASFPGGETALINFLQKNLRSPQDLNEGETIQVRVKYVVGFDGNLQSFDVIQDGGSVFNNEVIRVLKKMPKWNPGKKGGRNVPVYYSLPVKFTSAE